MFTLAQIWCGVISVIHDVTTTSLDVTFTWLSAVPSQRLCFILHPCGTLVPNVWIHLFSIKSLHVRPSPYIRYSIATRKSTSLFPTKCLLIGLSVWFSRHANVQPYVILINTIWIDRWQNMPYIILRLCVTCAPILDNCIYFAIFWTSLFVGAMNSTVTSLQELTSNRPAPKQNRYVVVVGLIENLRLVDS